MTNLVDSVEEYGPHFVYLLCAEYHAEGKPNYAIMELKQPKERTFGKQAKDIEHAELKTIPDVWSQNTMMSVFEAFSEIKSDATNRAGGVEPEFFAGLSDAAGLLSPSVAFAAVLHDMKTYFTRGRRTYYDEFVLEIDNLNNFTVVKSWIQANKRHKDNLKYLIALIELEESGEENITPALLSDKVSTVKRTVDKAILTLEKHGLIHAEGKRGRKLTSTDLGRLVIRMKMAD
tara:strand:+ start:269 stop:964 length:696 start_codon:yes stop_codon:yes gene_type:complete